MIDYEMDGVVAETPECHLHPRKSGIKMFACMNAHRCSGCRAILLSALIQKWMARPRCNCFNECKCGIRDAESRVVHGEQLKKGD
jgi:hypothetical protein